MGFLDGFKDAASEFLSEATDDVVQDAQDKVTEATGLDQVTDAVDHASAAKESAEGAFDTLRNGLFGS